MQRKPKPKSLKESTIQSKVIKAFEDDGWLVIKNIQTNKNGWPDLTCYKDAMTIFIEVKAEDVNEVRPLQLYRHQQLQKQNFTTIIINHPNQIPNAITIGSSILQQERH